MIKRLLKANYFFTRQIMMVVILSVIFKLSGFLGIVYVNNFCQGGEEAGKFFLIMSCVQVGLVLVNLGHASFYARLFARYGKESYCWSSDLKYHTIISGILSLLYGYILYLIYGFTLQLIILTVLSIVSYNFVWIVSGIVRGYQKTAYSFIIQNIFHCLWPLFAYTILKINSKLFDVDFLLINYTIAINVSLLLAIIWVIRHRRQQGSQPITWKERQESIAFYALSLTAMVLPYADKLILGLEPGRLRLLAGYQGLAAIFAFYDVITLGLGWVLMPRLAMEKRDRRRLGALMAQTLLIIVLISGVALLLGPLANSYLYGPKFLGYNYLIKYFVIIGALKILFSVQTSLISAQGESMELWLQGFWVAVLMGLSVVAMKYGLEYWGLEGLMLAQILGWTGRCLITTGIIYQGLSRTKALAIA